MKPLAFIVAALAAFFSPAWAADLVAKGQNSRLELSQKPCAQEILAMIPPHVRDDFRGGSGTLNKETQPVCWTEYDRDHYLVIFADGSGSGFPKRIFKLDEGV